MMLRPLVKCVPKDASAWLADTALYIRSLLGVLDDASWTQSRIAVEMGCSERSIQKWAKGETDMSASKLRRLEALVGEVGSRRRTG